MRRSNTTLFLFRFEQDTIELQKIYGQVGRTTNRLNEDTLGRGIAIVASIISEAFAEMSFFLPSV